MHDYGITVEPIPLFQCVNVYTYCPAHINKYIDRMNQLSRFTFTLHIYTAAYIYKHNVTSPTALEQKLQNLYISVYILFLFFYFSLCITPASFAPLEIYRVSRTADIHCGASKMRKQHRCIIYIHYKHSGQTDNEALLRYIKCMYENVYVLYIYVCILYCCMVY